MKNSNLLTDVYDALLARFGPQNWWPGDTPLEISIGAILTQNTNWSNVEKAIARLKQAGMLSIKRLREVDERTLAELIRPSGYYNQKARRLKGFVEWMWTEFGGDVDAMLATAESGLRDKLLSLKGIGPETADSILLYAAEVPKFVVDAYTYRIFSRHGAIADDATYEEIAEFFEDNLPCEVALYNEYHALIVALGKNICKKKPKCDECPLYSVFDGEPVLDEFAG